MKQPHLAHHEHRKYSENGKFSSIRKCTLDDRFEKSLTYWTAPQGLWLSKYHCHTMFIISSGSVCISKHFHSQNLSKFKDFSLSVAVLSVPFGHLKAVSHVKISSFQNISLRFFTKFQILKFSNRCLTQIMELSI